tara:strand:+ start:233 stop:403 length:171 start_codon:yes stop_codon:yes gene_type:complete
MKTILRLMLILALLFAAISSYSYGSTTGTFFFIILGFVFEAAFYFKLFSAKKSCCD